MFRMENDGIANHALRHQSYSTEGSSDSSDDITVTGKHDDIDGSSDQGYTVKMDAASRPPIFIVGEEDGMLSAQGLAKNIDSHKIVVGVCAMAKKTNSKPMKEILGRLKKFEHLQMIVFDEAMIISDPVENWPVVDALISFFSNGFPLQKAIEYKNLRKPFVVNDLEAQYILFDSLIGPLTVELAALEHLKYPYRFTMSLRREVYNILVREGIAHPRYAIMNRDNIEDDKFDENEDAIEVNGVTFQRPFVEKPVCAEDHNIYIYFPVSAGGGCQRLFRKVGSRSSVYSTINRVRKTGSYIYEDFMPTDGTDVKVYTVGPDYAHAEARKSPALDGKVERDKDGKEIRYPVLLSASEKLTARKVCMAFKQNVCGFDLLRANGKSYVCDVNGFSFVKNSTKYYDDCANVLGTMIVRALAPQLHIPLILGAAPEDIPVVHTTSGSMMELRCVVAVIRHGDRTPKQKMKMEVKHQKFFKLFEKYGGFKSGHLKLKKPKQLQEILDIARDLLHESDQDHNPEVQEKKAKLRQLKLVLEMYEFSGINRKIQLKYQPQGRPPESSDDEHPKEPSLVLIVKWGGELTPAGKFQAEDLGKAFRTLYPGGQGEFETPGLGFLRLHSTFRHDLKIYASDEGRVQMTAAAFTKGLLALEGELTPILVSMVKSANTNGLLDKEGETSKYQHVVKEKLMEMLNEDREFTEADMEKLCPSDSSSLQNALKFIENPRKMCDRVYEMVHEITAKIKTLKMELKSRDLKLYHGESWELLIRRWAKLEKDFKLKSGNYDVSKIPDIYDCIKYDLQHNQKTLQYDRAEELFMCSKALADIVIPQEYGIKVEEKLHISQSICTPLLRKIHSDLLQVCQQNAEEEGTRLNSKYSKGVSSPERFVRTRLYFTSESHIHSLLNMFRYGGLFDATKDEQWKKATDFLSNTSELNYMTQINIMMFEDPSKEFSSPERFHIELHFSPGAYTSCDTDVMNPLGSGYRTYFLYRQKKKHEEEQVENTKKDMKKEGMKEGVIHQTICEEGLGEESDHSKEDSETSQLETRSDSTKTGARAVPGFTPVILIDPSEKKNKVIQKEKSPKTAKSDTKVKKGSKFAVTGVGESADVFSTATTADSSVSEQTLCPESLDDLSITDSQKTLKDSKEKLNSSISEKAVKGETSTKKTVKEVPIKGDNTNVEIMAEKTILTKQEETTDENKMDQGVKKRKRSSVTFDLEGSQDVNKDSNPGAETSETSKDSLQKVPITVKDTDETITVVDGVQVKNDTQQAKQDGEEDVLGRGMFTMGSQDNLEDLVGSLHEDDDTLEMPHDDDDDKTAAGKGLEVQGISDIPQPKSPDPDIPEWDWGDPAQDKKTGAKDKVPTTLDYSADEESLTPRVTEKTDSSSDHMPSPTAVSKPLTIQVKSSKERKRTGSFDSLKTYEEGRSRSLEDKSDDGIVFQSYQDDGRVIMKGCVQWNGILTCLKRSSKGTHKNWLLRTEYIEKHYLTIHLPINKDRHHHSFSSLLYLNPEAFKDVHLVPPQYLLGSYSAPDLSENVDFENQAFDGFNMVPSLKPLETLHNNLTLKDMDGFLSRATTTKFFTPVSSPMYGATPLVSPRMPEVVRHKSGSGHSLASLPSSSSSSAGPSSPTSVSTPVDLYSKLKMFIIDSQKADQDSYTDLEVQATNESDFPYGSSSSSSNSLSKSDPPCASYPSLSKFQTQTPGSDNQAKQSTVTSDRNAPKENLKQSEKARTVSEDEQVLKEDEQKTLTAKSPEAFQCLKPHSEQSQVVATTSKSPTSPTGKHPPQLAEPLKLDISEDNHKSAFKKVGKRFKMTHVPEDSLMIGSSVGNVNSSLVKESSISKDNKTSTDKVIKSTENTSAETSTSGEAKSTKLESDLIEAKTGQTSKGKPDLHVDSES